MKDFEIREYKSDDIPQMTEIWNEVVDEAKAFPQEVQLDAGTARDFFASQTACGVAVSEDGIRGMYILHPVNTGRCSHTANASYAVASAIRGRGIGRRLVIHSLETAKKYGFIGMQFNAVVSTNTRAITLYESLGFRLVGRIPSGFRNKDETYTDTFVFHIKLS